MATGYFLPPRFPPGFVPFRQRLPIYNSRQPRPQTKSITIEEFSSTVATENKDNASSTSDGTAEQQTDAKVDKDTGSNNKEKDESDNSDNDSQTKNG